MNEQDREPILAVALMAAMADGTATDTEKEQLQAALGRVGGSDVDAMTAKIAGGQMSIADVARKLTSDTSKRTAYETAHAVCLADGTLNAQETTFLTSLRTALGLSPDAAGEAERSSTAMVGAASAAIPQGTAKGTSSGSSASPAALDDMILQQAIITGACELLPDRLASMAIIPLQLRLVYRVGQAYGQQLDANQVKDLAGTLGIGAAAQMVERVVRGVLGGVGGILGGLIGGAAGMASGAAVTFASTYALGHVAKQYYTQGRKLSGDDLRTLFARFQEDAKTIFPKIQSQIQTEAGTLNLQNLLQGLR